MIIDLIKQGNSPLDFDLSIPAGEIDLENENVRLTSDVAAKGSVTKRIVQTDVEGEIKAEIEIDCTRCLNPVTRSFEVPFHASYIAPENYTEEKEAELRGDDLDIAISEDDRIDIAELVREQILLNLPEQVLCKEDCKGLCPKCGGDRNLIDCNCEEKEIDPRWSALEDLIK
jgi:uncharacterized protein